VSDHHVRPRPQELPVQLAHRVREVEHHLGDERARLDVAAPLQLEDVPLSAEHRAGPQPVHDRQWHKATPSAANLAGVKRPMS